MLATIAYDELFGFAHCSRLYKVVEILRIPVSMMVKHGEVEVSAHQLVHEHGLDGVAIAVVEISDAVGATL